MTTEKTLQELSKEHLNEAVTDFGENTRQIRLAEFSNNSNLVLRLKMKRKEIQEKINYWTLKIKNNE